MTDEIAQKLVDQVIKAAFIEGVSLVREDIIVVDLIGLECPEPLMMLRQSVRQNDERKQRLALATDLSTQRDIPAYCRFTGKKLIFECVLNTDLPQALTAGGHHCVFGFLIQASSFI